MADPERFDADPDPKIVLLGRKNNFLLNPHFFLLHNLAKLVMCDFLSNNAGGGARGEG